MKKRPVLFVPLLLVGGALATLSGGVLLSSCRPTASSEAATTTPPTPSDGGGILPSPAPQPTAADTANDHEKTLRSATIYRVASDDNGSHLQPAPVRLMATAAELPTAALNAMSRFGKDSPLPEGAQAHSVVIAGDTATVDYNKAFQKNFSGGDENEALALNAVLATVGQFAGVKQVQITVEGGKIDSLGGTQTLSGPLPVPQTLDAPRQTAQSAGKSDGGDH